MWVRTCQTKVAKTNTPNKPWKTLKFEFKLGNLFEFKQYAY
jgi:hypothetical protein